MVEFPLRSKAFNGRTVYLEEEDWLHIRFRHPEVGDLPSMLMKAVENPSEAYRDARGGIHVLLRLDQKHFLVVIYEYEQGEGYIRTAYLTDPKRKARRYTKLQSVKPY